MNTRIHIERLVIDAAVLGNEPAAQVQADLERELSERLSVRGLQPANASRLTERSSAVSLSTEPLSLGSRIAASLDTHLKSSRNVKRPSGPTVR